jgi:DNA-binding response OmpR family regulator
VDERDRTRPVPLDVLVADDEPIVREVIAAALEDAGHVAHLVADGREVIEAVRTRPIDVVLLDLCMPGVSGFDVIEQLRRESDVPVVVVTGSRVDVGDRVGGFAAGADDYVLKPFSRSELIARVEAHGRRYARSRGRVPQVIDHGPLHIDLDAREVTVDGRPVRLARKEFELLAVLAARPGVAHGIDTLLGEVWGTLPDHQDRSTVKVHIGRLRRKLETDPRHPRWIVAAHAGGYRLDP